MFKKILFLIVFVICTFSVSFAADPFYTNLLNEGKLRFQAGKYDEALESFKLAEFGLLDEKEFVPELYYYYAITQYKNGAIGEGRELLEKMKVVLGEEGFKKAKKPKEIERDLFIMTRALDYLAEPGARAALLPFLNLFYETWDLLKAGKLPEAEAKLKVMNKMEKDRNRFYFLDGMLEFQKGDYKRCLKSLGKIDGPLPIEYGDDASFYLAYSYLQRGDLKEGEKWAQKIKDPEHIHQLMELMEEIKSPKKL